MGQLTTHVLDTAQGRPGRDISIELYRVREARELLQRTATNRDGRTDAPLLAERDFEPGTYELQFAIGAYFRSAGLPLGSPPFLDDVVIRITLSENRHYHVPLLVSPWSYTTYRGS